ncbi:hypothetical protein ON010_g5469 [Phytophthora cinnamomi]|nr:hypothetical protein ON010_g5469 [Phytophthora cinnamomi]
MPARGFLGAPRFYPPPLCPPRGFFPRFVPPRPPPPPPRPPVVDAEQAWLDNFRRTHCNLVDTSKMIAESSGEPPLRWLRRRVARAQKLTEQLKEAATELAAVEMRLESLSANYEEGHGYRDAAVAVEAPRLRVQRERKLAACESLKKELEAMNATSGLFPEQQLAEIRLFAARVIKKKAYRKRAKQRRRAEASIRRAVGSFKSECATPIYEDNPTPDTALKTAEGSQHDVILPLQHAKADSAEKQPVPCLSASPSTLKQYLDPETLTIDTLIAVRRAWDSYIVFPQTPGASTIPPHFVPPPSTPSPKWTMYAFPSVAK